MKVETQQVTIRKMVASAGKVFARKEKGEVGNTMVFGNTLWLGINDEPENYIEVDPPIEEEPEILEPVEQEVSDPTWQP